MFGTNPVEFLNKSQRNPFSDMITIGRADNNDIIIKNSTVSKIHASLHLNNVKKVWQITDRRSTNKTFLDGGKLEPEKAYDLYDNARIVFGTIVQACFYQPTALWSLLRLRQKITAI
jgi:pSer/pThr/pTyr-binding forkhead associated (FHA) protein